jgi:hypothetical protein
MHIPDEFKAITRNMCQDLDIIIPPGEDPFPWLLRQTTPAQATIVHSFLVKMLVPTTTDEELMNLWRNVPSEVFFFSSTGLRAFLTELQNRLAERMQEPSDKAITD